MKKARVIALYLPQFYPIPENDEWHGKGFTEWTNVAKAKPLFKGHYQPILPADLGFYDLRVPETRIAQAELAKEYGIEAFCYWHYWFGNGKRILERPFQEVVESGKPDFPFCLAWANSSWTGIWYGMSNKYLLKQTYPGKEDYTAHFYAMLDAFKDKRYLTVNKKPLFFVYDPRGLPSANEFIDHWQELAHKEGLIGFHFIGGTMREEDPIYEGFDGSIQIAPFSCLNKINPLSHSFSKLNSYINAVLRKLRLEDIPSVKTMPAAVNTYQELVDYLDKKKLKTNELPLIMPNWDNTARSGKRGSVITNASPKLFEVMIKNALKKIEHFENVEEKLIFVEAWNEWAEGNYLEPDRRFGKGFLEAIKKTILVSA